MYFDLYFENDLFGTCPHRGADVDQVDAASEPALWHAIEHGHESSIRALLELSAAAALLARGAQPPSSPPPPPPEGTGEAPSAPPSVSNGDSSTSSSSSLAIIPTTTATTSAITPAIAAPTTHIFNNRDRQSYAALAHCASRGHLEGVRLLLESGCSPHAPDQDGYTAYDYVGAPWLVIVFGGLRQT